MNKSCSIFSTLFATVIAMSIPVTNVYGQTDTTFTYQGELNQNGSPVTDVCDFVFRLFNAASGGNQVGVAIAEVINVSEGRFSAELDFGANTLDNSDRWLRIEVRCPAGAGAYTILNPRQPITRSPYSIQTRGIFVAGNKNVGIGTPFFLPDSPLHVQEGSAGNVVAQGNSSAIFERSGQNFVSILSPDNSERGILFGDPESLANGGIVYNSNTIPDGLNFRTGGNLVRMVIDSDGNVGIGTENPLGGKLQVASPAGGPVSAIDASSDNSVFPTIFAQNNASDGPILWAVGNSDVGLNSGGVIVVGDPNSSNIGIDANEIMARNSGATAVLHLNREGGDVAIGSASGGSSTLSTPVLAITGGSDFSEMFDVGGAAKAKPGMVVVIDPDHPGRLILSTSPVDRKVAGIISGAGGVATGVTMGHSGTIADGQHPVALSGRVYCLVDASDHAIEPGDMLTTSSTPGHAMKVTNVGTASGAIVGKAMTSLEKGQTGLVLVLVNLQ